MMRKANFLKSLGIILIITWAVSVTPAMGKTRSVCFRDKVTDRIKTNCMKVKGKYDAFATYKCFDKESGGYLPFDPKERWEELDGNDPCCLPEKKRGDDPIKGSGYEESGPEKKREADVIRGSGDKESSDLDKGDEK